MVAADFALLVLVQAWQVVANGCLEHAAGLLVRLLGWCNGLACYGMWYDLTRPKCIMVVECKCHVDA